MYTAQAAPASRALLYQSATLPGHAGRPGAPHAAPAEQDLRAIRVIVIII